MADDRSFDELDVAILEVLQIDARIPFVKLADELGVSDATVRARVNRLTKTGMIKLVADVDVTDLGLVEVYFGLRVQGPALDRAFAAIAQIPEIPFAAETMGTFDILCEVVCRDRDDLMGILRAIRKIPGITHLETISVLKVRKDTFNYAALTRVEAAS